MITTKEWLTGIGCEEIDLGFMIGSQEDEHDDL